MDVFLTLVRVSKSEATCVSWLNKIWQQVADKGSQVSPCQRRKVGKIKEKRRE